MGEVQEPWRWRSLYERFGWDPLRPKNAVEIARAVLARPDPIEFVHLGEYGLFAGAALTTDIRIEDSAAVFGRVIRVRYGIETALQSLLVAHECFEALVQDHRLVDPSIEELVNSEARGALAPDEAVRAMLQELGRWDIPALARRFVMPEVEMAIRLHELGVPLAIVSAKFVKRMDRWGELPSNAELRALADNDVDYDEPRAGLVVCRLRGPAVRVVLRSA